MIITSTDIIETIENARRHFITEYFYTPNKIYISEPKFYNQLKHTLITYTHFPIHSTEFRFYDMDVIFFTDLPENTKICIAYADKNEIFPSLYHAYTRNQLTQLHLKRQIQKNKENAK